MKIKVKKYNNYTSKTVDIFIRQFDCSANNILKLIDIFNLDTLAVVINSLDKDNTIFRKLDERQLRYTTSFPVGSSPYVESIVMAPIDDFRWLLHDLVDCDPGSVFLFNIKNTSEWERILYNSRLFDSGRLLKRNLADLTVVVSFEEHTVDISVSAEVYDGAELVNKIKGLFD